MKAKLLAVALVLVLGAALVTVAVARRAAPASRGFHAAAVVAFTASPAGPRPSPRKVAIVVYDQVEILDLAGPAEVLQVAGGLAGRDGVRALDLYLVGRTTEPVIAQRFIRLVPEYSIADAPAPDLVVIPGGNSQVLGDDPEMMAWLTRVTGAAETTLTVCTGAFPLARSGALDGLEVTTWYGAIERLREAAPKARVSEGRRFVDNGRIVTTAGVSAGIDGALHLVARMFGRRIADQTARYMEYHWSPEPYLAARYPYWNPSTDDRGRALQQAQLAFEEERWPEAVERYRELADGDPSGVTSYNLACAHARSGDADAAVAALARAFAAGVDRAHALHDPDLASIRDRIPE